jgi:hypothetical protein
MFKSPRVGADAMANVGSGIFKSIPSKPPADYAQKLSASCREFLLATALKG